MKVLQVEAIEHLANGEIVESSEQMKSFLNLVKKDNALKGKTDLEILEQFIEEFEAQKN